jgi:DNA-binding transcriptional LysR family regulator
LPAAALTVVPSFVARLEANWVAVSLSVQEGTMDILLPRLRAGDVDLLVGNLPHRSLDSDLDSLALYEDLLVGVVSAGHPLVQAVRPDWRQIGQWPMLLPPPGTSTRRALDEWLLHPLPLQVSNVGLHVGLVWLRRRGREGALQKIREMFGNVVKQMDQANSS